MEPYYVPRRSWLLTLELSLLVLKLSSLVPKPSSFVIEPLLLEYVPSLQKIDYLPWS